MEKAFAAFPSRVFVIDREGTVTFSMALDEQRFARRRSSGAGGRDR